jgi:hypothetical protein
MKLTASLSSLIGLAALTAPGLAQQPQTPPPPMSFFVTSVGLGDGAKLGGLTGADAHCQKLAASAGRGGAAWRAYLSQAPAGGLPQVNARDRIGRGPWYNAAGIVIAWNLEDLHEDRNNIRRYTALDEKGAEVKGRGDDVNHHDMLTGSDSMGRLIPGDPAFTTCGNWTSNKEGRTIVGHHDRLGGANASWNAVHSTRGCSQENLISTGGVGLFYCFAVD